MAKRITGSRITKLRQAWTPQVEAGLAMCPRCRKIIHPNPALPNGGWDMGHEHDLALGGNPAGRMVPEHSSCNRSAGARLGNVTRRRSRRRLGEWLR